MHNITQQTAQHLQPIMQLTVVQPSLRDHPSINQSPTHSTHSSDPQKNSTTHVKYPIQPRPFRGLPTKYSGQKFQAQEKHVTYEAQGKSMHVQHINMKLNRKKQFKAAYSQHEIFRGRYDEN